MNVSEIVDFLYSRGEFHDVEYLKAALNALELDIDPAKVIVVAGTNGKGSTCATLQTLLIESGKNVGFNSSPHLQTVNERIKFNGADISDVDFCSVFCAVYKKTHHMNLSFFEYITIMAAYYFFENHKSCVDFAIFEVGMGGTLDATNAIPHNTSVITRLGIDHEDALGKDLISIAENKFGIISDGNMVFHTKFDEYIEKIPKKYAEKYAANFVEASDYELLVNTDGKYPIFIVKTKWGTFKSNLQGARGAENTALAMTVFDYLVENAEEFMRATEKVMWPGRMELIKYNGRDVFLSGDHNPQGIRSMLNILQYYTYDHVHFVVGICSDKNYSEMLSTLLELPNAMLYLTETPERTVSANSYGDSFVAFAKCVASNPLDALDAVISKASNSDLIIVTGSLYLVGQIKTLLAQRTIRY